MYIKFSHSCCFFCFNAAQNYLFHPDEIATKQKKEYLLMEYKIYIKNIYIYLVVCCYFICIFISLRFCRQSCSNENFIFQRVFYAFLWNSFFILFASETLFCCCLIYIFFIEREWKICVCSKAMTKIVLYEYAILSMMTTAIRFLSTIFLAVFSHICCFGYCWRLSNSLRH